MQSMQIETPILSAEETRLLVELGFLAAGFRHPGAQGIFEALHTIRPDLSAPLIGIAMYCIESGKPAEAVSTLQKAIASDLGDRSDLQAILGMALVAAKRSHEAGRLLNHLVSTANEQPDAGDLPEIRMAKGLLKHHVMPLTSSRDTASTPK